jgi:hypothetical protein
VSRGSRERADAGLILVRAALIFVNFGANVVEAQIAQDATAEQIDLFKTLDRVAPAPVPAAARAARVRARRCVASAGTAP